VAVNGRLIVSAWLSRQPRGCLDNHADTAPPRGKIITRRQVAPFFGSPSDLGNSACLLSKNRELEEDEKQGNEEAYSDLILQEYEESKITQHGGLSRVTDRDVHGQTFGA